jgi:hypothetical protein
VEDAVEAGVYSGHAVGDVGERRALLVRHRRHSRVPDVRHFVLCRRPRARTALPSLPYEKTERERKQEKRNG